MYCLYQRMTPIMRIIRRRLYASTCRLISVRTFLIRLVRKWECPIQFFNVPKGCSTVFDRIRMASGVLAPGAPNAASLLSTGLFSGRAIAADNPLILLILLAIDSAVCFRRKLARANQRLSSLRLGWNHILNAKKQNE